MGLKVEKPGLLSTVQDLGRWGYQQEGVVVSGAMDTVAHRVANILVGNPEEVASLEFTLAGPNLRFEEDQVISLTGAAFSARVNGASVPAYRPVLVKAGALLEVGQAVKGCRGYLAISGGVQVPQVLGSTSTYLRAGIGGLGGTALKEGDVLPCLAVLPKNYAFFKGQEFLAKNSFVPVPWYPGLEVRYHAQEALELRVVKGPEYEWFTPESQIALWEQTFQVTPQSDRMGYRLKGPSLNLKESRELLSSAVTFGTVQVPAQGEPIVLMADHQTTGGYPRIAQVILADLPALAQARPGDQLRFKEISLEEAYQQFIRQEQMLSQLKRAVALKLRT